MESIIAGNIKRLIREKGLQQRAVAARAGYNEKSFSNMLTGRKLITDCDIPPICAALQVTPNDLFGVTTEEDKR